MHLLKAIAGTAVVLLIFLVIIGFFYEVELLPLHEKLNYEAFLTLMLTALGVMVALFTIFVGLAAIWGYAGFRDVVRDMAKKEVADAVTETLKKYPDSADILRVLRRLEEQADLGDRLRNQAVTSPEPKTVAKASKPIVEEGVEETPLDSIEKQATPIARLPGEEDSHGNSDDQPST